MIKGAKAPFFVVFRHAGEAGSGAAIILKVKQYRVFDIERCESVFADSSPVRSPCGPNVNVSEFSAAVWD